MTITKTIATAAIAALALTTASLAVTGEALAKGKGGHGGHHGGHHGHHHHGHHHHGHHHGHGHFRHHRYFGHYAYGYNSCMKWTPYYGWINVCRVRYYY